ncbi:hypothetical protein J4573_13505 [Actinomadura barringtoniae]|uniref:Bacterial phospholipase C C-terminal domain-containing protein n=1 Tax=Actinomadura barringtoniae TaxID=1427535 RepID=A0A939PF92_9ACTN|nr:hypothetical protein [Actinomadura barringtoniae]MBO2448114.1 hypothetical protein [Actinomadura barringtoniae]
MQLPRVVIAAVFFVIGALIAIPAILKTTGGESKASSTPAASTTSPSPSKGSPTPTATHTTASPKPLSATIGGVKCPERTVKVTVRNSGSATINYAIERNDGSAAEPFTVGPGATREHSVTLREDHATRIQVTQDNEPILVKTRTANCKTTATHSPTHPPSSLPHTGADDTMLWARGLTGAAAMVTGVIIFWYGGVWPRRRDQIFAKKSSD